MVTEVKFQSSVKQKSRVGASKQATANGCALFTVRFGVLNCLYFALTKKVLCEGESTCHLATNKSNTFFLYVEENDTEVYFFQDEKSVLYKRGCGEMMSIHAVNIGHGGAEVNTLFLVYDE